MHACTQLVGAHRDGQVASSMISLWGQLARRGLAVCVAFSCAAAVLSSLGLVEPLAAVERALEANAAISYSYVPLERIKCMPVLEILAGCWTRLIGLTCCSSGRQDAPGAIALCNLYLMFRKTACSPRLTGWQVRGKSCVSLYTQSIITVTMKIPCFAQCTNSGCAQQLPVPPVPLGGVLHRHHHAPAFAHSLPTRRHRVSSGACRAARDKHDSIAHDARLLGQRSADPEAVGCHQRSVLCFLLTGASWCLPATVLEHNTCNCL